MVPRTITRGLRSLRRRERLLQLASAAAILLAGAVVLLWVGGFIDWIIDREQETPQALRYLIAVVQVVIFSLIAWFGLVKPICQRLPNEKLAVRVERANPHLHQRLISAVQLNQEGADTEGMSPALIAQVTREADQEASRIAFARVANHARLKWASALLAAALGLAALPFLLWPTLAGPLLNRQFLANQEIPRRYSLEPIMAEVFPQGEKVQLRFKVAGPYLADDFPGVVRIQPEGQPRDRYELIRDPKVPVKDGTAIYVSQLPAISANFTHVARVGDGRSKEGKVQFVPPPVVSKLWAWSRLPSFVGLRPNGQPYEIPQGQGDVAGIPGFSVRVRVQIQKPVNQVILHLGKTTVVDESAPESKVGRHLPMAAKMIARGELEPENTALTPEQQNAPVEIYETTFDLNEGENYYEIEAVDEYGFVNQPRPRRTLRIIAEEPPQVTLLKEYFPAGFLKGLLEDFGISEASEESVVEGIPVLLGQKIRIPYQCSGPYGLGQARVLYRQLKKVESGNDLVKETPWTVLPLGEVKAGPKSGDFLPHIGAFSNSPFLESIPFFALPSPNPDFILGRTQGGGRYDLETTGLVDHLGKPLTVKVGDQIEYCVEVFADKNGNPNRPFARSETRVKTIVSLAELTRWMEDTVREEQAIRSLDKKQRGLFDK